MPSLLPASIQPPLPLHPTLSQLSAHLSLYLPIRPKDVPFVYHSPRPYFPQALPPDQPPAALPIALPNGSRPLPNLTTPISRIIFSITPTPGVYTALDHQSSRTLLFLHRPFTLDRRRVPRGIHVLASHTAFDEVLTVGYNTALALRLGIDVESSSCLQGYKGDPDRRIGVVGVLNKDSKARDLLAGVEREFGTVEESHGFDVDDEPARVEAEGNGIKVVAIMNAFHLEEVDRVLEAAVHAGWIANLQDGKQILYLTGQAREPGLKAAMEKGVKVVCVGHRTCEEWGIRYLARETRLRYPGLDVVEVMEEEEPLPPKVKTAKVGSGKKKFKEGGKGRKLKKSGGETKAQKTMLEPVNSST